MKTKNYPKILVFALSMLFFFVVVQGAIHAVSDLSNITFPVEELGSCQSESECKDYCDQPGNVDQCLDFAGQHSLMTPQEIEGARKFLTGEVEGPGGCKTKDECIQYCNDIKKIDQCVAFAEDNNLLPPSELQEFKQVQAALDRGLEPLPCKNKQECELYCEDPSNMRACIHFGKEAGFLKGRELQDAEKMLAAIERGSTPPPCRGRESCEEYCSVPENMGLCLDFALEAGFMSEEEQVNAKKMLTAIKGGVKPLTCGSREKCNAYCSQKEHFEECVSFAEAAGFMSSEESAVARKTGGVGPGGCQGKESCESFCQNPANQEICSNFAKEHSLMPEKDLEQMQGKQQFSEGLSQPPPEAIECLKSQLGADFAEKMQQGEISREQMEAVVRECGGGHRPMSSPASGSYPCQTPEECEKLKQEMMNRKSDPSVPSTGTTPDEYQEQNQEQYQQQYEEQKRLIEQQQNLQIEQEQSLQIEQQLQQQQQTAPTSFFQKTLLGSLLHSLFQLLR